MDQLSVGATRPVPKITCPADLRAVVGTKMTCSMPLDGKPYDVTITVTSVRGHTTKFDVDVASEPSAS